MVTTRKTTKPRAARKAPAPSSAKPAARKPPVRKKAPSVAAPAPQKSAPAVAGTQDREKPKPKLVRDSFTIPKAEYAVIDALKSRAALAGSPAKKSELLRAGIKLLAGLSDAAFLVAVRDVPAVKTGRPAKS